MAEDAIGSPPIEAVKMQEFENLTARQIEMGQKAYSLGIKDHSDGKSLDANPYMLPYFKDEWLRGWASAERAARQAEQEAAA